MGRNCSECKKLLEIRNTPSRVTLQKLISKNYHWRKPMYGGMLVLPFILSCAELETSYLFKGEAVSPEKRPPPPQKKKRDTKIWHMLFYFIVPYFITLCYFKLCYVILLLLLFFMFFLLFILFYPGHVTNDDFRSCLNQLVLP